MGDVVVEDMTLETEAREAGVGTEFWVLQFCTMMSRWKVRQIELDGGGGENGYTNQEGLGQRLSNVCCNHAFYRLILVFFPVVVLENIFPLVET